MRFSKAFVCFALVCQAAAQEQRLTLGELVRQALTRNPEILAAQKRYEAARQRPSQESALPDPMIGVGYNASGVPLPGFGLGREPVANIGVMVTQEIPYPGKRRLAGEIASREADAEFQQYQAVQLNVLSRVKQAYFRLQHAHAQTGVIDRNRELLRRLLKISEIRYSVGQAMQQDVFRTQTQLSLLETKALQFERERRAREAELNALLHRPIEAPMPSPEEPHADEVLPTIERLYEQATTNSPMLRRDEKMIQRSELAFNLARKDLYPDFAVSGGYYNMGSMPAMYMVRADIRIPLSGRRQRAGITEQSNLLHQSRTALEATSRTLQFRIKDDYLMAQTALELMKLYSTTVVPQANLAMESALSSYQTGTAEYLPVLMNYMTVIDYEMNYHEEMQNYHLALARLAEMTGVELTQMGNRP